MTDAEAAGHAYEHRVHRWMLHHYASYVASPWVRFEDKYGIRWCQPDGFFLDLDRAQITIAEIKIKHTTDAWWQLRHLYEPVLAALWGDQWRTACVEICAWFDRSVVYPEPPVQTPDPTSLRVGVLGVHICTPKVRDLPKEPLG